jgi:hypothetical protein
MGAVYDANSPAGIKKFFAEMLTRLAWVVKQLPGTLIGAAPKIQVPVAILGRAGLPR